MHGTLAALAAAIDEGVVVLEAPAGRANPASARVICCNAAARRLLGIVGDPIGRPLAETAPGAAARLAEAVASASAQGGVARLTPGDGGVWGDGTVAARLAIADDGVVIVLREEEPGQAERACAEFEEKMACAARVCGCIGHDMNNLLAGILGYAELADDCLPPGSPGHEHLAHALQSIDRASALTADLLAAASREIVLSSEVDLLSYLPARRPLLEEAAGPHVVVELHAPETPLLVFADRTRLDRVLSILASNAGRAMPDGGVLKVTAERHVVADARVEGAIRLAPGVYARIAVADQGIGFDPSIAARLFEPFYSAWSGSRSAGLGLAVAYGIVRQAGGFLGAEGQAGLGATFRVYLPERRAGASFQA